VLVVEDNPDQAEWTRRILAKDGHSVTTARSCRDALKQLGAAEFDLVVTDLLMPDIDGLELIRELAAAKPGLRIVVVSGSSATLLRAARSFGAVEVLRKPVTPTLLRDAVRAHLASPAQHGPAERPADDC
jgi:two-component system chemotaxis response regulator CheY